MASKESKFTQRVGDVLGGRYTVTRNVGAGTYGSVYECTTPTGSKVAIKKLLRLEDIIDARRVLREIRILRCCNHENIMRLIDLIHVPQENGDIGDIYLVTPLMETDLYSILKSRQPLTNEHAQYFVYQLLRALKYLHSAGICHRDIKPSNILVNASCDIVLCDFGLARSMDNEEHDLTEYVVTRFYRAPEIMLSSQCYSHAVDVWSVGCTLGEILGHRVLFPGSNYVKQINLIIDALGTPGPDDIEFVKNPHARKYLENMPMKPGKSWDQIIGTEASPQALELLGKMLTLNPARRISVEEALADPYLEFFHDATDEPVPTEPIDCSFERDSTLTYEQLKNLIRIEFAHFSPVAAHVVEPE